MLRSIAVIGVIVAAVAVFTAFLRDDPPDPGAKAVDYRDIAAQAREAVGYPLLAPPSLPDGWRSNSARLDPGAPPAWHLGVVTDGGEYIGLEQQDASVREMVRQHAEGSEPQGADDVAGHRWKVRTDGDGNTTYVRHADGATVLVTGDAPSAQIESYIESLKPVPK